MDKKAILMKSETTETALAPIRTVERCCKMSVDSQCGASHPRGRMQTMKTGHRTRTTAYAKIDQASFGGRRGVREAPL